MPTPVGSYYVVVGPGVYNLFASELLTHTGYQHILDHGMKVSLPTTSWTATRRQFSADLL